MISRILVLFVISIFVSRAEDFNHIILQQIQTMPKGGNYSTTKEAHQALKGAVQIDSTGVRITPEKARPSYCSGATYLVFLRTIGELQKRGLLQLSQPHWKALLPTSMADGEGVWGRWNANGPGTPRLFYELRLGKNFTAFSQAMPGDFMKIFWTDAVGKNERGHSVIYLGMEMKDGVERVKFWSSNKPGGYGEKSVSKAKIARAIFSRLEYPENLISLRSLPQKDHYLAHLLYRESNFAEALRASGAE